MAKPKWHKIEAGEYEYHDDHGVLGGSNREYLGYSKGYRWNAWTFNEWIGYYERLMDAKSAVEYALSSEVARRAAMRR